MEKISVIVPIFNASNHIEKLINSLKLQDDGNFEVILINNKSTDETKEKIYSKIEGNNNFKVFDYFEKPSSYASRNFGVLQATGDIYAFTDADCIPTPTWLSEIRKNAREEQVVSGHVELLIVNNNNIWEAFDKSAHMKNKNKARSGHIATANMAVTKSSFERVGPFKEVSSGGDYEWSKRALLSGCEINFVEEALVMHPTRKTREEIESKLLRIATGQAELKRSNQHCLFKKLCYSFKTLNPLRTLKYTFGVYKLTGLLLSLKFFLLFNLICIKQVKLFNKTLGA